MSIKLKFFKDSDEAMDEESDLTDVTGLLQAEKITSDGVNVSSSIEDSDSIQSGPAEVHSRAFEMVENVNSDHHYLSKPFNSASVPKSFVKAVQKELRLLQSSLPTGIFVKAFESR